MKIEFDKLKLSNWLKKSKEEANKTSLFYEEELLINKDVKVIVFRKFGDNPSVHLSARDSVSIVFGEYVYDLSNLSTAEQIDEITDFMKDVKAYGVDQTIMMHQSYR